MTEWSYTPTPPICLNDVDRNLTFFFILITWTTSRFSRRILCT